MDRTKTLCLTEVQHRRWVRTGAVVGQEANLSLPLLLLDSQFGSPMPVSAATAEQNKDCPQKPEPLTRTHTHTQKKKHFKSKSVDLLDVTDKPGK